MNQIGDLRISSSDAAPFAREKLRAALVAAGVRRAAAGQAVSLLSCDIREKAPINIEVLLSDDHREMSLRAAASPMRHRSFRLPTALSAERIQKVRDILAFLTRDELLHDLERQVEQRTAELARERERSERLLRNMLPDSIAARMKNGEVIADHHSASVMFLDVVGFTAFARDKTAATVVEYLDRIFRVLDATIKRHGLEKIKTIGDGYLVGAGLPQPQFDHVDRAVMAGLDIVAALPGLRADLGVAIDVRIGIHSGDVIAGVIGIDKPFYDIWGDTVNVASRLESYGEAGKVHVSDEVRAVLGSRFRFTDRGLVELKNRGRMNTWFVDWP